MSNTTLSHQKPAEIYLKEGNDFTADHVERDTGWLIVFQETGEMPTWIPAEDVHHVQLLPRPTNGDSPVSSGGEAAGADDEGDSPADDGSGDEAPSTPATPSTTERGQVLHDLFEFLVDDDDAWTVVHIDGDDERWVVEYQWSDLEEEEQTLMSYLSGSDEVDASDVPGWVVEEYPQFPRLNGVVDIDWSEDDEGNYSPEERRIWPGDLETVEEVVDG